MAKIWKMHYPATRGRAQPKNFSGLSSWNFQRDSESLDSQLIAVYSQSCCYSNRDAQAWTQERDRTPAQQLHLLFPITDSQDTLCHQVHLNHSKWQKAAPTASYGCSPPGSQELGKEVNREHQQHRECRPLWEGKTNTKVPHSPLKAQPSFPPLESATLFPQQQHQRSHPEGNCFLYTLSEDKIRAAPCFSTF